MSYNPTEFDAAVKRFAAMVADQLHRFPFGTGYDRTRCVDNRLYVLVDVGRTGSEWDWCGRYMVEKSTGDIFGIRAYGKINRRHYHGNLATAEKMSWWGGYRAVKKEVDQ